MDIKQALTPGQWIQRDSNTPLAHSDDDIPTGTPLLVVIQDGLVHYVTDPSRQNTSYHVHMRDLYEPERFSLVDRPVDPELFGAALERHARTTYRPPPFFMASR